MARNPSKKLKARRKNQSGPKFIPVSSRCYDRFCTELTPQNILFKNDLEGLGQIDWRRSFGHDSTRCIKDRTAYVGLRAFLFATMLFIIIWSFGQYIVPYGGRDYAYGAGFWFIYLTHWGLFTEVLYLGLALYTSIQAGKYAAPDIEQGLQNDPPELPGFVKCTWLLYSIVLPISFMIFAMYWGLVFDPSKTLHVISVLTHGVNFVVMFIDTVAGSMPYALMHSVYFFAFAFLFLAWSLFHFGVSIKNEDGEDFIYSSLDWNKGGTPVLALMIMCVVAPLITLLFWWGVNLCNEGVCGGGAVGGDGDAEGGGGDAVEGGGGGEAIGVGDVEMAEAPGQVGALEGDSRVE